MKRIVRDGYQINVDSVGKSVAVDGVLVDVTCVSILTLQSKLLSLYKQWNGPSYSPDFQPNLVDEINALADKIFHYQAKESKNV